MKNLCFILLFTVLIQAKGQQWKWAKNISFQSPNATLTCIEPGKDGNFYASAIEGTVATHILKFDSLGNELWRKTISGNSRILGISANDSSVFIGGAFWGTMSINNQLHTSLGGSDIFFARLSANGNFSWCKCIGGYSDDACSSVCADISGNVYLTGSYVGTMDFDGQFLTGNANSMLFIAKYNNSGNRMFVKSAGTSDSQNGYSMGQQIKANPNQRIYLLGEANNMKLDTFTFVDYQLYGNQFITSIDSTGLFEAPYEVGPGTNEIDYFTASESGDLLFTGWDGWTSGSWSKTQRFSTNYNMKYVADEGGYCWGDGGAGCSVAHQKNNCYMTGWVEKGGNCYPLQYFFILVKYDSLGHHLLKDTIRGTVGESIIINDKNNGFIVGGYLYDQMQLGPYHLTNTNPVFLARFADAPSIVTGTKEILTRKDPEVYPNPAKNILHVKLDNGSAVNSENISLTNLQGQTMLLQINTTDQTAELSIDHLTPGIYFLGIKTDGIKRMKKIIID